MFFADNADCDTVSPCPCDYDNVAQDVNLWSGPDSLVLGYTAYWINEEN